MSLVYIDTMGNFGQAQDLVIFDTDCFDEKEIGRLNRLLDEGNTPFTWVVEMGERLKRTRVLVENSVSISTAKVDEQSGRILRKKYGIS